MDDAYLTLAVIPTDTGYEIIGFDARLRARFRMTEFDRFFAKIDSRMDTLGIKSKRQNKSEMATPNQPFD